VAEEIADCAYHQNTIPIDKAGAKRVVMMELCKRPDMELDPVPWAHQLHAGRNQLAFRDNQDDMYNTTTRCFLTDPFSHGMHSASVMLSIKSQRFLPDSLIP
jgi:hypothetical protein